MVRKNSGFSIKFSKLSSKSSIKDHKRREAFSAKYYENLQQITENVKKKSKEGNEFLSLALNEQSMDESFV